MTLVLYKQPSREFRVIPKRKLTMTMSRWVLAVLFCCPFLVCADQAIAGPMAQAEIPVNWGNLTALGAVIVGLLFLVVYYVPQSAQRLVDLSESLTKEHAKTIEGLQTRFNDTMDKIHARGDEWNKLWRSELERHSEVMRQLAITCAQRSASVNIRDSHE